MKQNKGNEEKQSKNKQILIIQECRKYATVCQIVHKMCPAAGATFKAETLPPAFRVAGEHKAAQRICDNKSDEYEKVGRKQNNFFIVFFEKFLH